MFHSLKTKIFILICIILALVAALVLYFTDRDVERAMFDAEQRSARNVLELVELNIQSGYRDLQRSRVDAVSAHRRNLQGMTTVARTGLDELFTTAGPDNDARERAAMRALDWLSSPTLVEGTDFLVFGANGRLLAHPIQEARGIDLNLMSDIKGTPLASSIYEEARRLGSASSMFFWDWEGHGQPIKKFGWFVHYPLMDWIVGAAVDIEELEREGDRKLDELLNNLRLNFKKIRIAKSGSVFLFNSQGEMLIQPENGGLELMDAVNALTGALLLDELKTVAEARNHEPLRFLVKSEPEARVQEAFCGYFRALGWYVAAIAFVDEVGAPARDLVQRLSLIIAGVFLASLALGLVISIRVVKPLNALAEYAKSLPRADFTSKEEGFESIRDLPAKNKDEVGRLAKALMFMEQSLRENIRTLIETTAANERIEGELNVAREIQMGLLPKTFPAFPERCEFDLFASLESAKEVGGDLYDFFFMDQDHFCFAVGDVSGKGVPAALFMAISRTLLRAAAVKELDPARIMESMNNDLASNNPNSMFVTMFIGVLNVRTGKLRYANGGHNQPVLQCKNQEVRFLEGRSGPMVGAMDDLPYACLDIEMAPGESIFLYSDGITEAMNENNELYSDERLLSTLGSLQDLSPQETIHAVLKDVALHVGQAEQSDDITTLCLCYNGIPK